MRTHRASPPTRRDTKAQADKRHEGGRAPRRHGRQAREASDKGSGGGGKGGPRAHGGYAATHTRTHTPILRWYTCTRTHTHHGTGRSAGATPRHTMRRGRQAPTAAAVNRAPAGARRPDLPAPTTAARTSPPLYHPPTTHLRRGGRNSRSGKRAKWGGEKKGRV